MTNKEYISKQSVLDALEEERKYLIGRGQLGAEHVIVHNAILVVDELQPEIVRCGQCKHWKEETKSTTKWIPCIEMKTDKDWFCADGKRD